jgi:hypothetical protein
MGTITFQRTDTKECPYCGEIIQGRAIKCRYCAEFLNTEEAIELEAALAGAIEPEDDQDQYEEQILYSGRPSLWAMVGTAIRSVFFVAVGVLLLKFPFEEQAWLELSETEAIMMLDYRLMAGSGLLVLTAVVLLYKAIKLKMIYYEVTPERIEWSRGIFDRRVDNLDMFRVRDLRMRRSLLDCLLGIGTVELVTSDESDPEFTFCKVHRSRGLYDAIKRASLEADRRDGVIHVE